MRTEKKKGFAIILVAGLAGLVFLLGAALVALSRLQSATTAYDQRTQMARDHARAALEMALAELQEYAGDDQVRTYIADMSRETLAENFNAPTAQTSGGPQQPFWTAAHGSSGPVWLVTAPIDSDFGGTGAGSRALPQDAIYTDSVKLVGDRTSTSANQLLTDVLVPRERIRVASLPGYTGTPTIGHYAYWVGDLGVKASYMLYDKAPAGPFPSPYASGSISRLQQLRSASPGFEGGLSALDTNAGASNANPTRIDGFASDFVMRDIFADGVTTTESYLSGLPFSDVKARFNDFTPLSKGLLVNAVAGGVRDDLSRRESTGDVDYDSFYLPYVELAASPAASELAFDGAVFPISIGGGMSSVLPAVTRFNLNFSAHLSAVSEGDLSFGFAASVELWNPFSSSMAALPLRLEVTGVPQVEIWLTPDEEAAFKAWDQATDALPSGVYPSFAVGYEEESFGYFWWPNWSALVPGQIAYFSGPVAPGASDEAPYLLPFEGAIAPANRVSRIVKSVDETTTAIEKIEVRFKTTSASIGLEVYNNETNDLLATYSLPDSFTLADASTPDVTTAGTPLYGFSWEVEDGVIHRSADYHPLDKSLSSAALDATFSATITESVNTNGAFSDSSTELLGYNADYLSSSTDNVAVLELPKQEVTSVANLAGAYGSSYITPRIGEPGSGHNDMFDQYYFSTIPKTGTLASTDAWPNSGYRPILGATDGDLQSNKSAEHLYAHGMFNINSTSIEAWAAVLKGSRASRAESYWQNAIEQEEDFAASGGDDGNSELNEEYYLFFNLPQSAENIYRTKFAAESPDGHDDNVRHSLKQGMFFLTEPQVEDLATFIVKNIRARFQGVDAEGYPSTNEGPFVSLEDFLNSEVLHNAIADYQEAANEDEDDSIDPINPTWVVPGSAREFRQSTILNLIAPYISVRSDTFLIRAYGDAVDPADVNKVWTRAYCEAVVQRTHELVDSSVSTTNRKFKIVAFRWLSPSEI